jgi:bifunctional non-homologous end joining protein LigD
LQHLPDAVPPSREELAAYWAKIWKPALVYLGRRPLKLGRHVKGTTFYHKKRLPPVPDAVHKLTIEKREGGEGTRLWVDDLAGLLGLVEICAVELHAWNASIDDIEHPDMLVCDLAPGEGVAWDFVIETALRLRAMRRMKGWSEVDLGLTQEPPVVDEAEQKAREHETDGDLGIDARPSARGAAASPA